MPSKSKKKSSEPKEPKQNPEEEPNDKKKDAEEEFHEETSPGESSFVTNEQVLWLRNVIRAQARDILQEMMDNTWGKIEENGTIRQMIQRAVQSETGGLQEKVNDLIDECKKKQRRIERLEHENCQKQCQITTLKLQLDELHQQRYNCSLQVVGLPEVKSESDDIKQVIKLSKEKLNIKLKSTDVEVTRLGKKRELKTRNTVLTFKEKSLRDKIYECRKKISTKANPKDNIYINDRLTKHRQSLLFAARNLVKSKKLFAAWAQHGNILIRKTETSKIIEVHDHNDLKESMSSDEGPDIEILRGNTPQALTGPSIDSLSITTHLSDYSYYVDSDV